MCPSNYYEPLRAKTLHAKVQNGQLRQTGLERLWVTDLTVDSNELLGVTFRPWRKLHISQSSAILHTTYRDISI